MTTIDTTGRQAVENLDRVPLDRKELAAVIARGVARHPARTSSPN
jgi:hypothetical protein